MLCLTSVYIILKSGELGTTTEVGMDWREYSDICRGGGIENQEACSSLSGVRVTWEGHVLSTRIASVHNPISSIVHHLPQVCLINNIDYFLCIVDSPLSLPT